MISSEQEEYILHHAYIPEHLISLMVGLSGGEPFYEENFVFFVKKEQLIFIGYPLPEIHASKDFTSVLRHCLKKFRPQVTWFIAPEIPPSIRAEVFERESDFYYILKISSAAFPKKLLRAAEKAGQQLNVEKSRQFSLEHILISEEYLGRDTLPPRIKELFARLPNYIKHSPSCLILSARNKQGKLSAYYVLELAGKKFITYVLGGYSRENYVPHASDLLFYEMYRLANELQKEYIHLGLGVNEGIRRFKMKWGGHPYLPYEAGAILSKSQIYFSIFDTLREKL